MARNRWGEAVAAVGRRVQPPGGTDGELLERFARDGDEDAFRLLVLRHAGLVWGVAVRRARDRHAAEDAAQAAFLALARQAHRLSGDASVAGWLHAVAGRAAARTRRRPTPPGLPADPIDPRPDPLDTLSAREVLLVIDDELARLPDRYRLPLLLCGPGGLTRDEAAAQLGWPVGSVKGRLERGRELLRRRLDRRGVAAGAGLLGVGTTAPAGLAAAVLTGVRGPAPAVAALAASAVGASKWPAVLGVGLLLAAGLGVGLHARPAAVPADPPAKPAAADPAKLIRGTVADADGMPVEGATVVAARGDDTGERLQTVTDAAGRFRFDRWPAGGSQRFAVWVIATKDGFAPGHGYASSTDPKEVAVKLTPPTAVAGTAVGPNGERVAGAEVLVGQIHRQGNGAHWGYVPAGAVRGTPAEPFYLAKADAAGRFRLPAVPLGAELIFRASAAGLADLDTGAGEPKQTVVATADAPDVELRMQPEAVITGRVRSKVPGVGVGGLSVRAEGTDTLHGWSRTLVTAADGTFVAAGLPAGAIGLSVELPADAPAAIAGLPVVTTAGKTTAAELEVVAGVLVTGRVRVAGTHEPVSGVRMATLGLVNPSSFAFGCPPTRADGTFRFRLPPGKVMLRVWDPPPGYERPSARQGGVGGLHVITRQEQQELEVPADKPTFEVAEPFELLKAAPPPADKPVPPPNLPPPAAAGPQDVQPTELAGVVLGPDGQPLAGVKAHVWDWFNSPRDWSVTGADGVFRVKNREAGEVLPVRYTKPGYSPVVVGRQPVGVKGLVVRMDQSTKFTGTVRGPDGKPAAGARVRADQGPKQFDGYSYPLSPVETTADAAGRYTLFVNPAEHALDAKAKGVGTARLPKTAIAHGETRAVDLDLQPGLSLRARVVDSVSGKPVPGLRLHHWREKDITATADAAGILQLTDLLPGKTELQVHCPGYARWWCEEAVNPWQRRSVADPATGWQRNFDDLTFDLRPGLEPVTIVVERGVTIRGKVVDPDGKPVSGATAAPARTGSGNSLTGDTRFSVLTNPDGTFTMTLPASGEAEYNLVAHDGKYQEWRKWANGILPPIKTTPGRVVENVVLTLSRPAAVRGRVVDAAGKPVAGREVAAKSADFRENRYYDPSTKTAADGTFELKLVRPGSHFLAVAPFWMDPRQAPPGTVVQVELVAGETAVGVELVAGPERPQ